MARLIIRVLINAIGLYVATLLIDDIRVDSDGTLIWAAITLGLVNALVRPLVILLTLPATVLTLGVFLLVINAAMLHLAAWLVSGFHVQGFFSALFGAIIVSLVTWATESLIKPKERT